MGVAPVEGRVTCYDGSSDITVCSTLVRRCNREALASTAEVPEFLFGSERSALTLLRPALVDLQGGRCFYCDGPVRAGGHVDHFVPWSRYTMDLGHNLVVIHESCNSAKRLDAACRGSPCQMGGAY